MNLHTVEQCLQVSEAIGKWNDYLQHAILNEDAKDCANCLNQIEQLLFQLQIEKKERGH